MAEPNVMYCIGLSRRLKKTIHEIMQLSADEITLQMAYDLTQDKDFQEKNKQEVLNNEWHTMDKEDKEVLVKMMFDHGTKDK